MSNEVERCRRYLLTNWQANRQPTVEDVVLNCDVTRELAEAIMADGIPRGGGGTTEGRAAESERARLLGLAKHLTCGDRNEAYGPPYENLSKCASLWEVYISAKNGCTTRITAEDVAWLMVLLKMARSFQPGYHADSYTDAAAYAAIAGECRDTQESGG